MKHKRKAFCVSEQSRKERNMDDQLLPCPFCGSENIVTTDFGASTWFVQCDDCGATFPHFDTETEAIAAWNRRAEPHWIPVTERLPDCDDKWGISKIVLCLDARGRVGFGIYQNGEKQLYHAGWFTGGGVGEDSVTVTHWMPLPEPPKEG
jgi:Lar family restriction alleviation protein